MAKIDPFVVELVPGSLDDPEVLFYLDRFLHDMWLRVNGNEDQTASAEDSNPINRAALAALRIKVGSGEFGTIDDTGFTIDNNKFSIDISEL